MEYPMNQCTRLSIALCSLLVLASACKSGDISRAKPHQQRLTPASLRNLSQTSAQSSQTQNITEAWALFDRSTSQGFQPTPSGASEQTYLLQLSLETKLTQLKIFGSSPYLLTVQNESGEAVSVGAIDLSKNSDGWNQFTLSNEDELSAVQLHFVSLGEPDSIAELELWGEQPRFERPNEPELQKLLTADKEFLLPQFSIMLAEPNEILLQPSATEPESSCLDIGFVAERDPRVYQRMWLSFEATNLFRGFGLSKGWNENGIIDGFWLAPSATEEPTYFVEELDPETLLSGLNILHLCLPGDANAEVSLRDIALVGELETGTHFISDILLTEEGRISQPKNLGEAFSIQESQTVVLSLSRLVDPSFLEMTLNQNDAVQVRSTCLQKGLWREISQNTIEERTLTTGFNRLALLPTSEGCEKIQLEVSSSASLSGIALVGSGTSERIDWPEITFTSAENLGGTAIVRGFVKAPSLVLGPIRSSINERTIASLDGLFSETLTRNSLLDQDWSITISSLFATGKSLSKTLLLKSSKAEFEDALSRAEAMPKLNQSIIGKISLRGQSIELPISTTKATTISLGEEVSLEVPAGAMKSTGATTRSKKEDKIKIKHLGKGELPELPIELINVTAPDADGFEFTPHGQTFDPSITLSMGYDDTLIPEGSSVSDIQTYYYDEDNQRWEPLDKLETDIGTKKIKSKTTHFTIMINAVLMAPDNSNPTAFTPTDLASIAAADPAAGIDFIQPPTGNSSGDVGVSFPLWVPPGRGAFSPSLSASYSSGGGNGWMGVGWDLKISNIQIDTRFGVPTYEANEEPPYLLDGQALVPVPFGHNIDADLVSSMPKCTDGSDGKQYQPRVEGSFFLILRCGASPLFQELSSYHWEVTDRSGTIYIYGRGSNSRLSGPLLRGSGDGIFAWYLEKVQDIDGNLTAFSYEKDLSAFGDPHFIQIYPQTIFYTEHSSGTPAST
jgi:hypothetical protein